MKKIVNGTACDATIERIDKAHKHAPKSRKRQQNGYDPILDGWHEAAGDRELARFEESHVLDATRTVPEPIELKKSFPPDVFGSGIVLNPVRTRP